MAALASVMTAKQMAAISSIQLAGESAHKIIKKIFKPTTAKVDALKPGSILIGNIFDAGRIIDHVVIGCEGIDNFAINCHGNPLIVEMIMNLLKENGAELLPAERFFANQFAMDQNLNSIEKEAKLTQLKAVTIEGVKFIANQTETGLGKTTKKWLENIATVSIEEIHSICKKILARSSIASLIINGAKIVITGPPNSGKSTLLNCLAGREKAIVTDIAGTTRDWVDATCLTQSLLMRLFDTAGMDKNLLTKSAVDKQSQQKAVELLADCDLVLMVFDKSRPLEKVDIEFEKEKKIIVVLNKSDLGSVIAVEKLDFDFKASVSISAKTAENIDDLIETIRKILGITDFDAKEAICFTDRQESLLSQMLTAKTKSQVESLITELLNGEVCV